MLQSQNVIFFINEFKIKLILLNETKTIQSQLLN
jgi:hypothetical protein